MTIPAGYSKVRMTEFDAIVNVSNDVVGMIDGDGTELWLQTAVNGLSAINGAAAASANVTAIQAALTAGGLVQITTPGTYYINARLVIGSNTHLYCAPGVVITEYAGSNTNMLVSSPYLDTGTVISGAWSSGFTFTVTWTAHGRVAGDSVWLSAFAPSQFNGVFRVQSVTDANTFTVQLYRAGAALTDSAGVGRGAAQNIAVEGGMWNYNSQSGASGPNNHAIIMAGVDGLVVRGVQGKNASKYVLNVGAVANFCVEDLYFPQTASDGMKLYGPAYNGRITGLGGNVGDDMFSMQTKEPDLYSIYRWTFGDIVGVKVASVAGTNDSGVGRHIVLYGSDAEWMDGIEIDGVHGSDIVTASNCIYIGVGDVGQVGKAGRIRITNVTAGCLEQQIYGVTFDIEHLEIDGLSGTGKIAFGHGSGLNVKRLVLRRVTSRVADASANSTILFGGSSTFGEITIEDGYDQETAGNYYAAVNGSTIGTISLINNAVNGAANRRFFVIVSGTVKKVRFIGNNAGILSNWFVLTAVTGVCQVEAYGNTFDGGGASAFLNLSASCKVAMGANNWVNCANGVIRTGGTPTIEIRSDGTNQLQAGSWIAVPSGTPVLTVYGWDIAIDPIAVTGLAGTVGQFCTSTQAGNESGLAVRGNVNGTPAWYALAGGAAGVNAAIT